MNYGQKAVRGGLFAMGSIIATSGLGYVLRIILARQLSVAEYGLFYSVFGFISFLLFFRDLGLNQALVKYIAEFKAGKKYREIKAAIVSVFLLQLIVSVLFAVALYFSSEYLSVHFFRDSQALMLVNLFAVYILISFFGVFLRSAAQGFQRVVWFSGSEVVRLLVVCGVVVIMFKSSASVYVPIYAHIAGWLAVSVMLIYPMLSSFSLFSHKMNNFKAVSKQLFFYGSASLFTSIGSRIISQLDTLMLTYYRTLEEVGVYNVVLPSALLFLFASQAISIVLFPLISELKGKGDVKRINQCVRVLHTYAFIVLVPAILAVFVYGNLFISIFFGAEYVSGVSAFKILLIGVIAFSVSKINQDVIAALGKPQIVTIIIGVAAGLNLVGNLLLIPTYGIVGAAITTTASYGLALLMSCYYLVKLVEVKIPWIDWGKVAVGGVIFVFVIDLLRKSISLQTYLELVVCVAGGVIVYCCVLKMFKVINVDEVKQYWAVLVKR